MTANLVAKTISCQRFLKAFPRSFSLAPLPYMSAVSKEIDAQINGLMQGVDGFGFVKRTVKFGHAHATKTNSIDG
jgi:hypothetical protein